MPGLILTKKTAVAVTCSHGLVFVSTTFIAKDRAIVRYEGEIDAWVSRRPYVSWASIREPGKTIINGKKA